MFNFSKLFRKKIKYDTEISSVARDFILKELYNSTNTFIKLKSKFLYVFKQKKNADKLFVSVLNDLEDEGRILNVSRIDNFRERASKLDVIKFIK